MKTRKDGVILVVIGLAMVAVMFVPLIFVQHPDGGRFWILGPGYAVTQAIIRTLYSPYQFIVMLFSNGYNLRGYVIFGYISVILVIVAIIIITIGFVWLVFGKTKYGITPQSSTSVNPQEHSSQAD